MSISRRLIFAHIKTKKKIMPQKIKNLKDLLIEETRELYLSNKQELKELSNIEKVATSADLKKFINKQIVASVAQQEKLDEVLKKLNYVVKRGKSETTKSILNLAQQRIKQSSEPSVRDAGIVNSLQYLSHRKIAGFGSGAAYANQIGQKETAKIFHTALKEEKKIDAQLSKLAERELNKKASISVLV